ncbi:hypothetical protein Ddye_001833 [Dipteronia dyeriana]|uniref:HAT C-terminal dimerisation domain-containing protein n=1 Tax=Dipteronia dyeriana TaxID=168575 RepID=A0AAD9XPD6_9ROSI|nr:hypothetical protein Ddye_001833 [Dipteronia dyeriana]
MTGNIKDALVELYECYSALYGCSGVSDGDIDHVDEILSFGDLESENSSMFDLSFAFSETIEKHDIVMGKNEVERYLLELVERKRSNFDILTWWSVSSAHYPILTSIAKD